MHLLYIDESGHTADSSQKHFILAGISVHEKTTHWLEKDLNSIASRFSSNYDEIELHGSPMLSGRGFWRSVPKLDRINAIKESLELIKKYYGKKVRLFAAVMDKSKIEEGDISSLAFEQIASRFDYFLIRIHNRHEDDQRGIMVFDESSTENTIQSLSRRFKHDGHKWGNLKKFAEVPVFMNSKSSRLIQLADLIAFSIFRKFERDDEQFFEVIQNCFDYEGGIKHGLYVHGTPCSSRFEWKSR